ncbi:MAG: hypothetical protein AB7T19_00735 [Planctomycetota bacterium]
MKPVLRSSLPFALFLAAAPWPMLCAQDPLTVAALRRIEQVEAGERGLAEGDRAGATQLLNQLAWAGKRLNAVGKQSETSWREAKARYDALWQKLEARARANQPAGQPAIDQAKLVQLDKEIGNAKRNFGLLSRVHLNDGGRVRSLQRELEGLRTRLATFPATHPDVQAVAAALAQHEAAVTSALAALRADQNAAGEMNQKIEELHARYGSENRLAPIQPPFEVAQVKAFVTDWRQWREQTIPADLEWLDKAADNAALDGQKVGNLRAWLKTGWSRRLDEIERTVRERIASDVTTAMDSARFVLETKADDPGHVSNRILGKGRFDEQMTRLREGLAAIAIASTWDETMGSPAVMGPRGEPVADTPDADPSKAPDRKAQTTTLEEAVAHLKELAKVALHSVRVPAAVSTDAKLLEIAKTTLANPKYGVHEVRRMVINAPLQHHTRREAWLRPGTVTSTIELYEYVWDQYQVTTVEEVGDELWLFANTLKRYESGDPTTPVGRWILSQRFELTPILAENVDK